MVTIYDIAKKTGYSAPTISKALNGTGGLSAATRKKIIDVAEEIGYKPNMAARALTTKKSFLIGIIYEDNYMKAGFEHPLFGGILNTFRTEMENSGYDLIFLSKTFGSGKASYLDHCIHRDVDGVVVINSGEAAEELIGLAQSEIPCVSTNDIIPGIPYVVTENFEAGRKAAEHFIKNGHKKFAYISGPANEYTRASTERLEGFKSVIRENHFDFDDSYVASCPSWFRDDGFEAMRQLYESHADITAVFSSNDSLAVGAMNYCKSIGLAVPDDVSFIGFDDEMFSSYCTPPLTTFKQKREEIAEVAAEILHNRLAGLPVSDSVRISADFIERSSVKNLRNS